MQTSSRLASFVASLALLTPTAALHAQGNGADIVQAADRVLEALSQEQRTKVLYAFDDAKTDAMV